MKSNIFFAALMCCLSLVFATEASANSWRVNPDQRAGADFLDLNAAMADERVVDGDILYMDKGSTIATEQTITKKVTIVGPGYFIGENDADEAYLSNVLYIEADGAKITGLHTSTVYIRNNNVIIERCRITGNIQCEASSSFDNNNAHILSCFIVGHIQGANKTGYSSGWEIANNIIYEPNQYGDVFNFLSNAQITHNFVHSSGGSWGEHFIVRTVVGSTITNNILINYYNNSCVFMNVNLTDNNTVSHNIMTNSYTIYPNNIANSSYASSQPKGLIVCDGSIDRDSYYVYNPESPAYGYGENSTEENPIACGPFDGPYPYVMCGYPLYVPRFESITVPSQPNEEGKLIINMKIVNQNQ